MGMTAAADGLVSTDAEKRSLGALRDASGEVDGQMERHCVRCFLLCERLAALNSKELDREVSLCAAFLHDIGLYDSVSDGGVYTQEGGELARKIGGEAGWTADRAQLCADACAYHHSITSKWDLGPEVETLRLADRVEVSAGLVKSGLTREALREVAAVAPPDRFYRSLLRIVGPELASRPLKMVQIFKP